MSYLLESDSEFERLEQQSRQKAYDFKEELSGLTLRPGMKVLDAGCGSGIVASFLAEIQPKARVFGCDASEERVGAAAKALAGKSTIEVARKDILNLDYPNDHFDIVVCRYVLHHLSAPEKVHCALENFRRVLKPNGRIWIVEVDGLLTNLFPLPLEVAEVLQRFAATKVIDFEMGRKLPTALSEAGFDGISFRIEAINCEGTGREEEAEMMRQRIEATMPFLNRLLGGGTRAKEFQEKYLSAFSAPNSVYFFNKFILNAGKKRSGHLRKVK